MSAKKKATTKKAKSTKTSKSTKEKAQTKKVAAKKSAPKKAATKKTVKKATQNRKTKSASSTQTKKAPKKATGKKKKSGKTGSSDNSGKNSESIKSDSSTGKFSKNTSRRSAPVTFSLDEVRELLKKQQKDEKKSEMESVKAEPTQPAQPSTPSKNNHVEDVAVQKSKHNAASLDDILGLSSAGGKSGSQVAPEHEKYHQLLIQLRDEVRAELNLHSNDTLKRSQKEDAGDIATSSDAGTDNFDRDFALSLLSSEQEALNEIEAAIARIYKGTYGKCEITGEPIAEERLEAVPFTRFSLEGQREFESSSRKKVQRSGAFLSEGSDEAISFTDDDGDN